MKRLITATIILTSLNSFVFGLSIGLGFFDHIAVLILWPITIGGVYFALPQRVRLSGTFFPLLISVALGAVSTMIGLLLPLINTTCHFLRFAGSILIGNFLWSVPIILTLMLVQYTIANCKPSWKIK